MPPMFSIKAIAIGLLAAVVAISAFGALIALAKRLFWAEIKLDQSNFTYLLVQMLAGLLACLVGGFVAAHAANRFPISNALAEGAVLFLLNLCAYPAVAQYPLWYRIAGIILVVPVSYLGGLLALR